MAPATRSRVKINITNNAELRANAQHVLTLTRAARPKNTSLAYEPKQREFKVSVGEGAAAGSGSGSSSGTRVYRYI